MLALKRLLLPLAAAVATIASPLTLDLAQAQGRGHDRGEGRGDREHGGRERGDEARGRWEGEGRWGYPVEERGEGRRGRPVYREPPPAYRLAPPVYRGGPPPGLRILRPGGYLPPEYHSGLIYDFQRYRLRPPPHGYAWVRVGDAFVLVSLLDGQIFDVIGN